MPPKPTAPPEPVGPPPWPHSPVPSVIALVAAGVTAFWSFGAGRSWIYDDYVLLIDQPRAARLRDLGRVLTQAHWNGLPYYRPLSRLMLGLERMAFGDRYAPYHVVNAALMGALAWATCALLRTPSLALPEGAAVVGAALVALHPSATESVFLASAGPETLAYLPLVVGAVAAWMRPGLAWRVLAVVLMGLALLFKEQAVVTPLLFVLVDALRLSYDHPARDWRRIDARYAPVVVAGLAWLALRSQMIHVAEGQGPRFAAFQHPDRVVLSFVYTLQTLLAPALSFAYEPEFTLDHGPLRTMLALALAGALTAFGLHVTRGDPGRRRTLAFGLGWCVLAVLPTGNLASQETHFAERYVLLAAPGLAVILAAISASARTPQALQRGWRVALGVGLAALVGVVSYRRPFFRDNLTFLRQWEAADPDPYKAIAAQGEEAMRHNRFEEALALYERALAVDPRRASYLHRHIGSMNERLGRLPLAEAAYRRAVEVNHLDIEAQRLLQAVQLRTGRASQGELLQAIERDPDDAPALFNLGLAAYNARNFAEAERRYRQTLDHLLAWDGSPADQLRLRATAQYNLGIVLGETGRRDDAMRAYRAAIEANPEYAYAHTNLGQLLVDTGRSAEAIPHFEAALRANPTLAAAQSGLARARGH